MSAADAHIEHQTTHRVPRLLIVVNDFADSDEGKQYGWNMSMLLTEGDCFCMKYFSKGEENVHMFIPSKYKNGAFDTIEDVACQAAAKDLPYDAIIVESEAAGKEIMRRAGQLNPKPAVIIYAPDEQSAQDLRDAGTAAFCSMDMIPDEDGLCMYDVVMEQAWGEQGVKNLECKPGEPHAREQWSAQGRGFKEVVPIGAIRSAVKFAGEQQLG